MQLLLSSKYFYIILFKIEKGMKEKTETFRSIVLRGNITVVLSSISSICMTHVLYSFLYKLAFWAYSVALTHFEMVCMGFRTIWTIAGAGPSVSHS